MIRIGEWLNGDGFHDYEHAAVVTGVDPLTIVEARPAGAAEVPYHYDGRNIIWSTGLVEPPDREAVVAAARQYIGTPYSSLDYFALALHRLHIPSARSWWTGASLRAACTCSPMAGGRAT